MKYASVCSGIEAATVAWHSLGWTPVFFSEIEPFPCAVLAHHYPDVPNYGDMTKFKEWPNADFDVLVGGTPCQSFSVAGLRKGLEDPRGNLMLTYLAIAERYRPQWIVWENVLGVLSSNGGRDFGTFLGALGHLGYGWAYRVLDAQWFGVAQRRRRVFVVGYLGDWQRAAAVLFESESVRRDTPPSRETGQDSAKCLTASLGMRLDPTSETFPIAPTLCANDGHKWGSNQCVDEGKAIVERVAETLMATDHKGPGHNRDHNFVAQPIPYDFFQITAPVNRQSRKPGDPCHTLARDNDAHATIVQPVYGIDAEQNCSEELIGTLRSHQSGGYEGARVAQPVTTFSTPAIGCIKEDHVASAITHNTGAGGETQNPAFVFQTMQVRRLTPVECERLQGFPDGYTNIPWRKKPESPDGPRYKALGNSMAVPVMRWIGERIQKKCEGMGGV